MRFSEIIRKTRETYVHIKINLDGSGVSKINTTIPFFDHMLNQTSFNSKIDIFINSFGDKEIDCHHLVEDIGIVLGESFFRSIGNKFGICRYGFSYVALDESLSRVVIDISGRPSFNFDLSFIKNSYNFFDIKLFKEFFQAFVNYSKISLHIDNIRGLDIHHQLESVFKAFGRALYNAISINSLYYIPSTKGVI